MNMNKLTDEVRLSLTEAGIGKIYHDKRLASDEEYGAGMSAYLKANGTAIRKGEKSVWFHGIGLIPTIKLFCRGLHINGVGCKIVPLVHMRKIINNPEFKELVEEIDVLVITGCADAKQGCPLHPNVMAAVEDLIRDRAEDNKSTFMVFGIDPGTDPRSLDNRYWSDQFMNTVVEEFEELRPNTIIALGKSK